MTFAIDKKIRFGYFSAFILLVISYLLLLSGNNKMLRQIIVANQSMEKIAHLEKLFSAAKDIETGYNRYLLTGDKTYLSLFYIDTAKVSALSKTLSPEFAGDTLQMHKFNGLQLLINRESILLRTGISLFEASGNLVTGPIKKISGTVKDITDSIRLNVVQMQNRQQAIIGLEEHEPGKIFVALKIINLVTVLLAVLIAIYSLITYTRENKARRKADEQAIIYRKQIELRVEELNVANKQLNDLKSVEKFAATGRMARMIAHEVRNPLTNIGLANDQLKDVIQENEESTMLMGMIKRNGERINNLIGDLLTATKFAELNCTPVDINDLVEEVLLLAKDRIVLSGVQIKRNFSPEICKVLIDAAKIKIALLNIILNAIEAVEVNTGVIEITTGIHEKVCRITITDNGIGISEESMQKLFEPFFTKKDKGNGLGLTNAQNIIFNHKGNIDVSSEPGKGSSFTINLPGVS